VCADPEEIGESRAVSIAQQAIDFQLEVITEAVEEQSENHHLNRVVAAGIGEKIVARASRCLGMRCVRLSERYSKQISDIFPAYAVARLLELHLQIENP
jgi:uncharacterized hydantoinase/oxoprolinase family protein